MTVPAIVTGVIRCFANSCLVLRDVVMSRTCSSSNHFGSLRSTMSGGYMFTKIVIPFKYEGAKEILSAQKPYPPQEETIRVMGPYLGRTHQSRGPIKWISLAVM